MPEIGETILGNLIGKNNHNRYIWQTCRDCGLPRWTIVKKNFISPRCCSCANRHNKKFGSNNFAWRGGRITTKRGYIKAWIAKTDTYFCMAHSDGYVWEHRLVLARHIGRPLLKTEHVHHINGIKNDNRIENLELLSPNNHSQYNQLCAQCDLRKEIRLFRWQVKELTQQLQGELVI